MSKEKGKGEDNSEIKRVCIPDSSSTKQTFKQFSKEKKQYTKKTVTPSKQSQMTDEEIEKDLMGFEQVEKEEGCALEPGSFIKYFNNTTNCYKVGGILTMNKSPTYLMLRSIYNKDIVWSMQWEANTVFVKRKEVYQAELKEMKEVYYQVKSGDFILVPKKEYKEMVKVLKTITK